MNAEQPILDKGDFSPENNNISTCNTKQVQEETDAETETLAPDETSTADGQGVKENQHDESEQSSESFDPIPAGPRTANVVVDESQVSAYGDGEEKFEEHSLLSAKWVSKELTICGHTLGVPIREHPQHEGVMEAYCVLRDHTGENILKHGDETSQGIFLMALAHQNKTATIHYLNKDSFESMLMPILLKPQINDELLQKVIECAKNRSIYAVTLSEGKSLPLLQNGTRKSRANAQPYLMVLVAYRKYLSTYDDALDLVICDEVVEASKSPPIKKERRKKKDIKKGKSKGKNQEHKQSTHEVDEGEQCPDNAECVFVSKTYLRKLKKKLAYHSRVAKERLAQLKDVKQAEVQHNDDVIADSDDIMVDEDDEDNTAGSKRSAVVDIPRKGVKTRSSKTSPVKSPTADVGVQQKRKKGKSEGVISTESTPYRNRKQRKGTSSPEVPNLKSLESMLEDIKALQVELNAEKMKKANPPMIGEIHGNGTVNLHDSVKYYESVHETEACKNELARSIDRSSITHERMSGRGGSSQGYPPYNEQEHYMEHPGSRPVNDPIRGRIQQQEYSRTHANAYNFQLQFPRADQYPPYSSGGRQEYSQEYPRARSSCAPIREGYREQEHPKARAPSVNDHARPDYSHHSGFHARDGYNSHSGFLIRDGYNRYYRDEYAQSSLLQCYGDTPRAPKTNVEQFMPLDTRSSGLPPYDAVHNLQNDNWSDHRDGYGNF